MRTKMVHLMMMMVIIIIIIIIIIYKGQIVKKPTALYKEHDGSEGAG